VFPPALRLPTSLALALLWGLLPGLAGDPALAQAPAGAAADDPFAPLPAIEPLADLPPVDFGPPIELPPVAPPDAELMQPLPPLASFTPSLDTAFTFTQVAEQGVRYSVGIAGLEGTGLEPGFRRLSALVRGQGRPATAAQIASRARSDEALMLRLLASEGWYSGTSDASATLDEAAARARIDIVAAPGLRYRWRQITLDLIPDELPELKQGFGLRVGDPIRAIAVEEAEGALLLKLTELGYPFVEIGARDVVLDADSPTGTYLLTGDLGPAGVFGPIRMTGFQPFDTAHAEVIARFAPGERYSAAMVDDFRRALIATQQFGGVTVTPVDSGLRDAEGRAVTEILVAGNRGPQRLLTGQLGYATDEGFRVEGAWRHRNFIDPEGQLVTRAVLGTEEQRASANLIFGNWRQRDRTLELLAELANLTPPAYSARTLTLGAEIGRASTPIWQKRWTWSVGAGFVASDERSRAAPRDDGGTGPEVRRTFFIGLLPGSVGYDRSDDLRDPTRGFRLGLAVTPELSRQGGDFETYARVVADASGYRPVGKALVLAGRVRVGSIVGADLDNIAPTRRLYAGGGGSVRGFGYQEVGPTDANGAPTGGRSLVEASVEGRYRFGDFGVVGFVDAGNVNQSATPGFDNTRFGVGIGGRYYTGFGPIRIDLARAIDRRGSDPKFAIYISIGQAF
jgi:translocation and assembly module TamA